MALRRLRKVARRLDLDHERFPASKEWTNDPELVIRRGGHDVVARDLGDYVRVEWRMQVSDEVRGTLESAEENDRREFLQELVSDVAEGRTSFEIVPATEGEGDKTQVRGTDRSPVPQAMVLSQRILLDLDDASTIQRMDDAISEVTSRGARVQLTFGGLGESIDPDLAPAEEAPERIYT